MVAGEALSVVGNKNKNQFCPFRIPVATGKTSQCSHNKIATPAVLLL
jgi:hypothetical protein